MTSWNIPKGHSVPPGVGIICICFQSTSLMCLAHILPQRYWNSILHPFTNYYDLLQDNFELYLKDAIDLSEFVGIFNDIFFWGNSHSLFHLFISQ